MRRSSRIAVPALWVFVGRAEAACRFHPRCEHATPRCAEEPPPAPMEIAPGPWSFGPVLRPYRTKCPRTKGHEVSCFLYS